MSHSIQYTYYMENKWGRIALSKWLENVEEKRKIHTWLRSHTVVQDDISFTVPSSKPHRGERQLRNAGLTEALADIERWASGYNKTVIAYFSVHGVIIYIIV